jgi:hypothetical protein
MKSYNLDFQDLVWYPTIIIFGLGWGLLARITYYQIICRIKTDMVKGKEKQISQKEIKQALSIAKQVTEAKQRPQTEDRTSQNAIRK